MQEIDGPTANSARAVRAYSVAPGRLLSAGQRAVEGLPRRRLGALEGEAVRVRAVDHEAGAPGASCVG